MTWRFGPRFLNFSRFFCVVFHKKFSCFYMVYSPLSAQSFGRILENKLKISPKAEKKVVHLNCASMDVYYLAKITP